MEPHAGAVESLPATPPRGMESHPGSHHGHSSWKHLFEYGKLRAAQWDVFWTEEP